MGVMEARARAAKKLVSSTDVAQESGLRWRCVGPISSGTLGH